MDIGHSKICITAFNRPCPGISIRKIGASIHFSYLELRLNATSEYFSMFKYP